MERLQAIGRPRGALGLRGRLVLFFVAIVVAPLIVALVVLVEPMRGQREDDVATALARDGAAATRVLDEMSTMLGAVIDARVADRVAQPLAAGDADAIQQVLDDVAAGGPDVDFVVAAGRRGSLLVSALEQPDGVVGHVPAPEELATAAGEGRALPGVVMAGRALTDQRGERIGLLAAGRWLDAQLLRSLPLHAGGAGVLQDGRLWAVAGGSSPLDLDASKEPLPIGDVVSAATVDGDPVLAGLAQSDGDGAVAPGSLVLWAPVDSDDLVGPLVGVVLSAAAVAALAGWVLAGSIIAPVRRAARAAEAIASGRLGEPVAVHGGGRELESLGQALADMNKQLAHRVAELEESKDQLRRSLSRLGETLSSSLDLDRTLVVVTETAMEALGADRAVLMLYTPERDALYAKIGRGVGEAVPRLRPGQGRLGWVAATGLAARIDRTTPDSDGLIPAPDDGEPWADRQLLVPLVGRGETLGVLSLMRSAAAAPDFREEDLETLGSFAAQAAVALENVLLHEEAQHRSLTDPLTGLWNFRHFEAQAAREFASAARFDRPLSLLVIDVDRFKEINDAYGHQVGDAVLREVAGRIRESARAPDLVARYGGEEFVVLLPGADSAGAEVTAERMRQQVVARPYLVAGRPTSLTVTCSIGVASAPEHAADVMALLRRADEAMYGAKQAGRNRVVVTGAALSDSAAG